MSDKIAKDIIELSKNIPECDFAVFLDRDGVINEEVHLLHKISDLKLIKGSREAIAVLNKLKIPVFLISNQTVLARGLATYEEFKKIHQKLINLLSEKNAHLDGVIYCFHSEKADIKEYRKTCKFRKPSPGMILEIEKRLKKVFRQTFVVGDQARDILMANKANAISILVKTGHAGEDFFYKANPDIEVPSLQEAVRTIVNIINNQNVSGVVLAGGKGTRLKKLTKNFKKELLKIGEKPLIVWQINNLLKNGIINILITLCHNHEVVTKYLKDNFKLPINTFIETVPLGTAGSLKFISGKLMNDFFVIYGDVINNVKLDSVLKEHKKNHALCTLVVRESDHPEDSDLINFDKQQKVTMFTPKPHNQTQGFGNCGIMIMNKSIVDNLPDKEKIDFMKDIIPYCINKNRAYVYILTESEYVKDVGTPERYEQANKDYMKGKIKL